MAVSPIYAPAPKVGALGEIGIQHILYISSVLEYPMRYAGQALLMYFIYTAVLRAVLSCPGEKLQPLKALYEIYGNKNWNSAKTPLKARPVYFDQWEANRFNLSSTKFLCA